MARKVENIAADLGMTLAAARTWLKDNGIAIRVLNIDTTPAGEGALKSTSRVEVVEDAKAYFDARAAAGITGKFWELNPFEPIHPQAPTPFELRIRAIEAKVGISSPS